MEMVIGFSRAKDSWKLGSKIIAESEKRDYSHAYIKIIDLVTEVPLVYQASLGMVNVYNYDLFLEQNVVVEEYVIRASQTQYKEILTFLHKNLGKPYSRTQVLMLSIKKLLRFEVDYKNGDESFIYSELAARIILMVMPDENVNNLDYYTPSDLNKLVNELNIPRL